MANKVFTPKDIENQLNNVLSDVENPVTKIIYTFKDEMKVENSTFLVDDNLDIKQALDLSNLSLTQAKAIAEEVYRAYGSGEIEESIIDINTTEDDANSKKNLLKDLVAKGAGILDMAYTFIDGGLQVVDAFTNQISDFAKTLQDYVPANSAFSSALAGIISVIADGMATYQDGVSETSFGSHMEESWAGKGNNSFLDYFSQENRKVAKESRRINFLKSTPLDPGGDNNGAAFYGTMVLGVPYRFNKYSDPTNRTLINTIIKDSKYLSLTPGMPKYNGTSYTQTDANNILMQAKEPSTMLSYLTRNGLDRYFNDKDKRYYTFKTDYAAYFSYLETMLNVIWIKLGLAETNGTFNLYTFFDIADKDIIDPSKAASLKAQYNSSIGFYTNIAGAVSESVDSQQTGFGSELAAEANNNSSEYQSINYITGMGTGSAAKNVSRKIGVALRSGRQLKDLLSNTFSGTVSALSSTVSNVAGKKSWIMQIAAAAVGIGKTAFNVVNDISEFNNTKDLGATIQAFATSNGMKVVYPELWSDSSYSKNINFNFNFVSPYGDPLSIFKYVYVPFCALACFAMPRQAAENGYVSPFFVRADVPGLISSDLALISSFTWTRGGGQGLWTKDGLPRAMECSITITDLYPYLSMTRRLSYMSANPSYSVFLDSMSGMLSLNDSSNNDGLNTYFTKMINRINGLSESNTLWNKFNSSKSAETKRISEEVRESLSKNIDPHAIPWLHNSSI